MAELYTKHETIIHYFADDIVECFKKGTTPAPIYMEIGPGALLHAEPLPAEPGALSLRITADGALAAGPASCRARSRASAEAAVRRLLKEFGEACPAEEAA